MIEKDDMPGLIGQEVDLMPLGATKSIRVMVLNCPDDHGYEWVVWSRETTMVLKANHRMLYRIP